MDFGIGSVGHTIASALDAAEQAKDGGKKVVVCFCGTHVAAIDATTCPGCGKRIKNAGEA